MLRLPFDSPEAKELSTRIAEEILLPPTRPLRTWPSDRPASGVRRDPRGKASCTGPSGASRPGPGVAALRERIAQTGLRNSLLLAIAPTATIASIAGCYECIEPQVPTCPAAPPPPPPPLIKKKKKSPLSLSMASPA